MENLTKKAFLTEELKDAIALSCDFSRNLCDYSGHYYICDAITDIADNNTSICYSDIIKYISENVEKVNDAIEEMGWDGCGSDLYKAGQTAEFLDIERQIYDELDESMLNYCYNYILYELKINEITPEQKDEIENLCCNVDNNETFDYFEDELTDLFSPKEDETEEN